MRARHAARSHPRAALPTGTFAEMARDARAICHNYVSAEDATDYDVIEPYFKGSYEVHKCVHACRPL